MNNLIRFNDPFSGLTSLHSQLDDMFNSFFGSGLGGSQLAAPAMDVYVEGDNRLVAEIHAPGYKKDDIEVNVSQGVLEIRGQRRSQQKEDGDGQGEERNYMVRESASSFYRRMILPKHADSDNVEASFEDGLLKVTVPFKEQPGAKRVEISSKKALDSKSSKGGK